MIRKQGESVAIIENRYGTFYGFSDLHPEEENVSTFVGCRYAEIPCYIEYHRHRRDLIDEAVKRINRFSEYFKGNLEL